MKKKWMVCMIACLMILLAGCNGNTAKETARNDTDKRISSTAGNTETTTETEKADDTSDIPETEQTVSSEAATELSPQEKPDVSSTAGSKTETAKSYEPIKDENEVDNRYLFQYLKAPFLMDYVDKKATGGTIKHLNQNILVDFPVVLPHKAEQEKIGEYFLAIDHLITLHQRKPNFYTGGYYAE